MTKCLFVSLLMFASISSFSQSQTENQAILACVKQLIKEKAQSACGEPSSVPGILVAVKFGSAPPTALAAGFSFPHCEGAQPLEPDMLFEIGSISKPLTSAALLKFSEQNFIQLKDRLKEWVPAMAFLPGVKPAATLRQTLQHLSGIRDYNQNISNAQPVARPPHTPPWENPRVATYAGGSLGPRHPDRFASGTFFWQPRDVMTTVPPSTISPGSEWLYSDANYTLMGMVWQVLANNANLVASLDKHIKQPSGMKALFLPGYETIPYKDIATAWNHHDQVGPDQRIAYLSSSWVAGGMLSTTSDITEFIYRLLGSRQLIGEAYVEQMKAFVDCKPGCYLPGDVSGIDWIGYGLGLMKLEVVRTKTKNQPPILLWGHGGKTAGFNSMTAYLPGVDTAFTITVNQGEDRPLTTWTSTITLIRDIARLLASDTACQSS